jgi:hypothetical protein
VATFKGIDNLGGQSPSIGSSRAIHKTTNSLGANL